MRSRLWLLLAALATIALAGATLVPGTRSGSGAAGIGGYGVSNVTYITDDTNPQVLAAVEFDLDYPAGQVQARLRPNGPWSICQTLSGNRWHCPFAGEPVTTATMLTVVAVQGSAAQEQNSSITVSNVVYSLDGVDTNRITAVALTLNKPVQSLSARLNPAQPWSSCSLQADNTWSCPVTSTYVITSTSSAILSQLELVAKETPASSPQNILVATYSYSGADKARAVAPPQCDPIRSSLQGVRSSSYLGPSVLYLDGRGSAHTIAGTPGNDCILSGGFNNTCCDSLIADTGDDVLIVTASQAAFLDGQDGYDRCYNLASSSPLAYRCEELNGHPIQGTVDNIALDLANPSQMRYVYVSIATDTTIASSLWARYAYNSAHNPCTRLSTTQWRCDGNGRAIGTVDRISVLPIYNMEFVIAMFPSTYGADKAQLAAPPQCDAIRPLLQGIRTPTAGYTGDSVLLVGTAAANTLSGSNGSDCIMGGAGNDVLNGEAGDDVILGGDGNDQIDGGPGYDVCYGNAGTDTVVNCEVVIQD